MPNYAHISSDGSIVNVIVANDLDTAHDLAPTGCTAVEITDLPVGIGWTYDPDAPEAEAFTAPPEPDPIPTPEV